MPIIIPNLLKNTNYSYKGSLGRVGKSNFPFYFCLPIYTSPKWSSLLFFLLSPRKRLECPSFPLIITPTSILCHHFTHHMPYHILLLPHRLNHHHTSPKLNLMHSIYILHFPKPQAAHNHAPTYLFSSHITHTNFKKNLTLIFTKKKKEPLGPMFLHFDTLHYKP